MQEPLAQSSCNAERAPDCDVARNKNCHRNVGALLSLAIARDRGESQDHWHGAGQHHRHHHFRPHQNQRRQSSCGPVGIIWVSLLGIAINTITALMFMSGRKGDLNVRGAFLHMAADAAISAGVVIAGLAILFTGRHWIDPIVSLLICAVIVWGTWDLLRESVNLALQGVPKDVDLDAVEKYLSALPGIAKVHDLHIWAMSTTEIALTAHLVKPDSVIDDSFLSRIQTELCDCFGIEHVTIQCECGGADYSCSQESEHVV